MRVGETKMRKRCSHLELMLPQRFPVQFKSGTFKLAMTEENALSGLRTKCTQRLSRGVRKKKGVSTSFSQMQQKYCAHFKTVIFRV